MEEDGLVVAAALVVLEPVQDFQFLMLLLTQSLLVAVVLV